MGLEDVQVLTFDVFGTVVNWLASLVRQLKQFAAESDNEEVKKLTDKDWSDFATEWRQGYITRTNEIANGAEGPLNVDILFREILDEMLSEERWAVLNTAWDGQDRAKVNLFWHRLDGWPDSPKGLAELKQKFVISTLTNGSVRLMADMAKFADLPWDAILSSELFGSYKPNPVVYRGGIYHLTEKPDGKAEQCAMVASHIDDLRAAGREGMRMFYIRRPTEDGENRDKVKEKKDGGEVDLVVDSFVELAHRLGCN